MRVLFVCKLRIDTYGYGFGLINSAKFTADALNVLKGVTAKAVTVLDNSFIWKEVKEFNPDIVFIDALWVVPEKFEELYKMFPKVKWVVRSHSKTSFISTEGIAMDWLYQYQMHPNVSISGNNREFVNDLDIIGIQADYLPNIYSPNPGTKPYRHNDLWTLEVGCFGAIRPFKNHLVQAIAAIKFAKDADRFLYFHVNANRLEQKGEEVYKNLVALFDNSPNAALVNHPWMTHPEFIDLVGHMDLGLQVSFTESFNIVTADFINNDIPIVVSEEIKWVSSLYQVHDPNSVPEIVNKMKRAWCGKRIGLERLNKWALHTYNKNALKVWKEYLVSQNTSH